MNIGPHSLSNNVFVAPMAGVTDRPFRQLCKQLGAGYAVSEMAASDPRLWQSEKTSRRTNHDGEMEPKAVQIAGADPAMLADCAKHNVDRGAQIIDINMGCPVKKVCNSWCGSALLQNEKLVGQILDAVVKAVDVPVTLKFRTGWNRENKNALTIAAMAEQSGIAMLTLHGRTRADGYSTTPERARHVLAVTGADAVMIGRAAQGRPWIFREIDHFLRTGTHLPAPMVTEVQELMLEHLQAHYAFYGEYLGVRTARKHIGWYVRDLPEGEEFRQRMNRLEDCQLQWNAVRDFFESQAAYGERLQYGIAEQALAA